MSSNIQLPDLSPATTIDSINDIVLIRQGVSDRKATVAQISNIVFSNYTITGTSLTSTDVLLIGKNNGAGVYQNYAINPQQIGFLAGTNAWFYQASAPIGWQIVPNTGDRVLGTVLAGGGILQYNGPGLQGTWQQRDVSGVANNGLTINQIPNHNHWGQWGENQSDSQPSFLRGNKSLPTGGNPRYTTSAILGIVGGAGDTASHDSFGACYPHNHGSNWRPSACVGIICTKVA